MTPITLYSSCIASQTDSLTQCCVGHREEGVAGLWKGVGPNIARNAIINAAELASYDQVGACSLRAPLSHLLPPPPASLPYASVHPFSTACFHSSWPLFTLGACFAECWPNAGHIHYIVVSMTTHRYQHLPALHCHLSVPPVAAATTTTTPCTLTLVHSHHVCR